MLNNKRRLQTSTIDNGPDTGNSGTITQGSDGTLTATYYEGSVVTMDTAGNFVCKDHNSDEVNCEDFLVISLDQNTENLTISYHD